MTKDYVTKDLVKSTYDAVSGGPWPDETYSSFVPKLVIEMVEAAMKHAAPRIAADVLDDLASELDEIQDDSTAGVREASARARRWAEEFRHQSG